MLIQTFHTGLCIAAQEFFGRLNNKDYGATGFFAPKPTFDQRQAFILYGSAQPNVEEAEAKLAADPSFKYKEFKEKYQRSRETVTRTGKSCHTSKSAPIIASSIWIIHYCVLPISLRNDKSPHGTYCVPRDCVQPRELLWKKMPCMPPCWLSDTLSFADYEVDFIDYFNQLVGLGATFNPDAYFVPIEIDTPRL